ncbi:MAG: peptide chain release factor N(5)-glutamine methyltransferase [Anaerolineales bacterium]|nr:peptide chain release factor N(5)-glutamine methyltransferase [Anaerolineales bacterium]
MFDAFVQSYAALQQAGVENAAFEALRLLDVLSGGVLRNTAVSLPPTLDLTYLAQQRQAGTPLEYILGQAVFMGQAFICTSDTLIPRQETELLANVALNMVQQIQETTPALTIADIGTGCGNLALTLAAHTQNVHVLASDISETAVAIAQQNRDHMQLQERVTLFCGDMFAPLVAAAHEQLDMVVCNPPYIPTSSLDKLAPEIIDHEPVVALDAGAYGLNIFRKLIADALDILRPGGGLAFEIGEGQEKLVERLLQRSGGYENILQHRDAAGNVRVFSAYKAAK